MTGERVIYLGGAEYIMDFGAMLRQIEAQAVPIDSVAIGGFVIGKSFMTEILAIKDNWVKFALYMRDETEAKP